MKYFFIVLILLSLQDAACNKNRESQGNCSMVTITSRLPACTGWNIVVNGNIYPSANIPVEIQKDGKTACVQYELYNDPRLCGCCGGTWANIKSIK